MTPANISQSGDTDIIDRVKRNAEIVALVKARKMPMRKIAARYRLSVSRISEIATKHRFMLGPQIRKRCGSRAN